MKKSLVVPQKTKHRSTIWSKIYTHRYICIGASFIAQSVKSLPAMQETQVWFLGQEESLEKEMATHSSILAWRIPWIDCRDCRLQSRGSQESDTTWRLHHYTHTHTHTPTCIGTESRAWNIYLFTSIHCIRCPSTAKRWKQLKFINRWTNTYNEMFFSLKMQWNSDTFCNKYKPWKHYAKQNEPVTKGQILYDSTYMKYLE